MANPNKYGKGDSSRTTDCKMKKHIKKIKKISKI